MSNFRDGSYVAVMQDQVVEIRYIHVYLLLCLYQF